MEIGIWIKGVVAVLGTWVSTRLGILYPVMCVLCFVMLIDFVSAWVRAIVTGEKLQSKKCSRGIAKKIGFLLGVMVGLVVDYLISLSVASLGIMEKPEISFAMLVAIWLILNDLISVVENLAAAGIIMPAFLTKSISALRTTVEKKK